MSRSWSGTVVCLSLLGFAGTAWGAPSGNALQDAIDRCTARVGDQVACTDVLTTIDEELYALDDSGALKKTPSLEQTAFILSAMISSINSRFGGVRTELDLLRTEHGRDQQVVQGLDGRVDSLAGTVDALEVGASCATAYVRHDASDKKVGICCVDRRAAPSGAAGISLDHLSEADWGRMLDGETYTFVNGFDDMDEEDYPFNSVVVNPTAEHLGDPSVIVLSVDTLHRMATGTAIAPTAAQYTFPIGFDQQIAEANARIDDVEADIDGIDTEIGALQQDVAALVEGVPYLKIEFEALVITHLIPVWDALDGQADTIADIKDRTGALEEGQGFLDEYVEEGFKARDVEIQFLRGQIAHHLEDSYADGHVRSPRRVAFVSGLNADGSAQYEVFEVSDVGRDPEATYTVDLTDQVGDLGALIEGTIEEPCAQVHKGGQPHSVNGKPMLLCLSPDDLWFGQAKPTSTVGVTYVNVSQAYEMHTGEPLVFSPYVPTSPPDPK